MRLFMTWPSSQTILQSSSGQQHWYINKDNRKMCINVIIMLWIYNKLIKSYMYKHVHILLLWGMTNPSFFCSPCVKYQYFSTYNLINIILWYTTMSIVPLSTSIGKHIIIYMVDEEHIDPCIKIIEGWEIIINSMAPNYEC